MIIGQNSKPSLLFELDRSLIGHLRVVLELIKSSLVIQRGLSVRTFLVVLVVCSLAALSVRAGEPPSNSDVAVDDSFDRTDLGKEWNSTTGDWKIVDGVLRGVEKAAEKHSAATRRTVATQNAVYELKFRLLKGGKSFHFGFDPAKGELKKKGHLFSVIVTPTAWKLLKHVDKNRRIEDPNETLAEQATEFKAGEWYTLRVTTWDKYVTARIEGKETLKCSHETFSVKKPTLVFRTLGDGVEIDDIKVWTQKK